MRFSATLVRLVCVGILGFILPGSLQQAVAAEPVLITKPKAFKTLVNPSCSYCVREAKRRAGELKPTDPVLAWTRSNHEGGAIPHRFFLEPYRVISDTYGVFVYDPDAGFSRGFTRSLDFTFHGWRNGIMVMKHKDGTLYSTLSSRAFAGPRKGEQLKAIPTITTNWGHWNGVYPGSVAYTMFEKYQPIELTKKDNTDSLRSRGPADKRLPTNTPVIGVAHAGTIRAYRIADLEKAGGLIQDTLGGKPVVVLWYAPTKTAAMYAPEVEGGKSQQVTLAVEKDGLFVDRETKSRWGIEGRAQSGPLKGKTLRWVDSVQCRWFAWAAEYPETEIYSLKGNTASSSTKRPANGAKLPETVIARLKKPVAVKFENTPLYKAFDSIGKQTSVTFIIDGDALKQSGYTRNMTQRFNLENVPATRALHEILKKYDDMTLVITNEKEKIVTVTTKAVAAGNGLLPLEIKP